MAWRKSQQHFTLIILVLSFGSVYLQDVPDINDIEANPEDFLKVQRNDDDPWLVYDSQGNNTCILMSGRFQITLPYEVTLSTSKRISAAVVHIPINALAFGSCDVDNVIGGQDSVQLLSLSWRSTNQSGINYVNFTFFGNMEAEGGIVSDGFFALQKVEVLINTDPMDFPEASDPKKAYHLVSNDLTKEEILTAPMNLSYYCLSTRHVQLHSIQEEDTKHYFMSMADVHAQPFHVGFYEGDGHDFGAKTFCSADGLKVFASVLAYVAILTFVGLVVYFYVAWRAKKRRAAYNSFE